ncbi:MAG: hypothetical protein AB8H80_15325 [Planctomycetota bacterium]
MKGIQTTFLALAACHATSAMLSAQCETSWATQTGELAVFGMVLEMHPWDPDGPGPLGPQMVVAGDFRQAGSLQIDHLARYDAATQTWSPIAPGGVGCDAKVQAIEVLPSGELVIGGDFTEVDGVPAAGLALWNGVNWIGLGPVDGKIRTIRTTQSGGLLVGGEFSSIGGVPASHVAMWDGVSWSNMGGGLVGEVLSPGLQPDGPGVYSVEELPSGQIFAVGQIQPRVSEWDGVAWTAVPVPTQFVFGEATAIASNGLLLVGGLTYGASVLRWNGTAWIAAGVLTGTVRDLKVTASGDLYAVTDGAVAGVHRRLGNGPWEQLTPFEPNTNAGAIEPMELSGGATRVFFGGDMAQANGVRGIGLFSYEGGVVSGDPGGANDGVLGVKAMPSGVYAYGYFAEIGGASVANLARWNGATWAGVGPGAGVTVRSVAEGVDGTLYAAVVGGLDMLANGAWAPVPGAPGNIRAMDVRPNGDLVTVGDALSIYDGVTWTDLQIGSVGDMVVLPDGDVVVSGAALSLPVPGYIARWDGSSWTSLDPSGLFAFDRFAALANGDLVAFEYGTLSSSVAHRFDGTNWTPMGSFNSYVTAIESDPAGQIYVAGAFTMVDGAPCRSIARWDGAAWRQVADGVVHVPYSVAAAANGDVFLRTAEQGDLNYLAVHETACPASAVPATPACASSGGANELVARVLPLIGTEYVAEATGLPAAAVAFDVFGSPLPPLPLAGLLPIGQPGCVLAVDPILTNAVVVSGVADSSFPIPLLPQLAGYTLRHQMLLLEVGAQSTFVAATSTNSLDLTVGSGF